MQSSFPAKGTDPRSKSDCRLHSVQEGTKQHIETGLFVQFPPDVNTRPGEPPGIFSPGQASLVAIFNATAAAAAASARGNAAGAATALAAAVDIEAALGYAEPPRVFLGLRACLAVLRVAAGDARGASAVAERDLAEFPGNVWGTAALHVARAGAATAGEAAAACPLLFGPPDV